MDILTTNIDHIDYMFTCSECGRSVMSIVRLGHELPTWDERTDNYYYLCKKCINRLADTAKDMED